MMKPTRTRTQNIECTVYGRIEWYLLCNCVYSDRGHGHPLLDSNITIFYGSPIYIIKRCDAWVLTDDEHATVMVYNIGIS